MLSAAACNLMFKCYSAGLFNRLKPDCPTAFPALYLMRRSLFAGALCLPGELCLPGKRQTCAAELSHSDVRAFQRSMIPLLRRRRQRSEFSAAVVSRNHHGSRCAVKRRSSTVKVQSCDVFPDGVPSGNPALSDAPQARAISAACKGIVPVHPGTRGCAGTCRFYPHDKQNNQAVAGKLPAVQCCKRLGSRTQKRR